MSPDPTPPERRYLVQVAGTIEVVAVDRAAALERAFATLAKGGGVVVRVEECAP